MEDPRRRPGGLQLGVLLLVSVMGVAAVGVLGRAHGSSDHSVVNIVGDPLSASATADGLTLTISVEHPGIVAGDRMHVDIALHNGRSTAVRWESDGCEVPFTGGVNVAAPNQATWDGDVASLASTLESDTMKPQTELRDVRFGGSRALSCTQPLLHHEVAPGADLRERAVVDLRAGNEELPTETAELAARFATLTVTLPIRVADARARRSSRAQALDAFTTDHRLTDFVDLTRGIDPNPANDVQSWRVDLSWWQGGWELWVDPTLASSPPHSLRMRFDPTTQKVVDVRRIVYGQVPGNDPDFEPPPGAEPDVLIP